MPLPTDPRTQLVPASRLGRRDALSLLSAGALAASACSRPPEEKIVPYREIPPGTLPGEASRYATSLAREGHAVGLLVTSREGRPTKIEGHPEHPASLGGTGPGEQAALADLYDPDRLAGPAERGQPSSWPALARALASKKPSGEGLCLLIEPTSSPLVERLIAALRSVAPAARVWFRWPLGAPARWAGSQAVYGRVLEPVFDLTRADRLLSLDADLASDGPFALRYARDLASRRVPGSLAMSRLYVAEPSPTPTGTLADHRLASSRKQIVAAAAAFALALARTPAGGRLAPLQPALERLAEGAADRRWADEAALDLSASQGRALVAAGASMPAAIHALVALCNDALSAPLGLLAPSLLEAGGPGHDLSGLCSELDRGAVDTLVIVGGDPAYATPRSLGLASLIGRARLSVYVGAHDDATARACTWSAPLAHPLESWGDGRALDGTVTFVQPLIRPLRDARSLPEVLSLLAGGPAGSGLSLLRALWAGGDAPARLGQGFDDAIRKGFLEGTAFAPQQASPSLTSLASLARELDRLAGEQAGGPLELSLSPCPKVGDGQQANNPLLQELPHPATKQTWGNAALIAPATARRLGLSSSDRVELRAGGRAIAAQVAVVQGQAEGAVSLSLGHGRPGALRAGQGRGADGYELAAASGSTLPLELVRLGPGKPLAVTQGHDEPVGEGPARRVKVAALEALPSGSDADPPALYRWPLSGGPQWAMAIDLARCTGCSACVVACQVENNVPTVGPEQVRLGREMHWLRIDRYLEGDGGTAVMPMLCQHCEQAPCEYVCPVNATTHSPDGLNEMTYNRCVGTRFCSNNCPYKVRRFNWLDLHRDTEPVQELAMNPEVTVRARGVMEKCTYCVQRIRNAEHAAHRRRQELDPGEVVTACAQACPTGAITFGSIGDEASAVHKLAHDRRAYAALADLGTRPRTRYLARVDNPNPRLGGG